MNIQLQVLGHALRGIAEEMGAALIRSAFSANIKERRDCSTALFDERGRMVAQAEHIPVHLGAMPDAVAAVMRHDPGRDDVFILNDPFAGGTHLPDITLVSRTDVGFAVTRAHHADVGGIEPGSMPAASQTLEQEGVVIPPTRLGAETLDELTARMRNPDERRGDFRAQLAAHRLADERIAELCARQGADGVRAAMDELLAYSERIVRAGIARLPDGRYEASDVLEAPEGTLTIRAAVTVAGDELEVDFAGTDPQHDGNLNCPISVTRSAAYFVVRCLTGPDVPASAGAFSPVQVAAPPGSLVNAQPGAAVAGGNVETSCRIVDVLFAALGQAVPVPAQGQGTMNNLTLGNDRFTYYETIGGGQGACPDGEGPSGVHVTMSNTLTTPTEALELAYPLRVRRHELRLGSGGAGRHRGGDGVVREVEALEGCRASILSERRTVAPGGAEGGGPGAPGRNLLNGRDCRRRQPSISSPETSSGSRRPAEAVGGAPPSSPIGNPGGAAATPVTNLSGMAVVEALDLHRTYRTSTGTIRRKWMDVEAVRGVSFAIEKGELFGLLGPNGAGKTTTIKMLITLLIPTSGTASVLGYDVVKDAREVRKRIGYVFGGERGVYERLSGYDNLRYFAELYGVPPKEQKQRIESLLELVGLKGREQERTEGYSRGMKQRLHVARGLLHDPPVVFLDEPTIGLDPVGARELRATIASLVDAGKTVLLTTHYMFEADALCDRIAVINKGEIVAHGTPAQLKQNVAEGAVVEVEIFGIPEGTVDRVRELPGVSAVSVEEREQAQVLIVQTPADVELTHAILGRLNGANVGRVSRREPTLEDAYVALVSSDE